MGIVTAAQTGVSRLLRPVASRLAGVRELTLKTDAALLEIDGLRGLYESIAARLSAVERECHHAKEMRAEPAEAQTLHFREVDQPREQHSLAVSHRDALLDERDLLSRSIQALPRQGVLSKPDAQHASFFSFPLEALPEGTRPVVHIVDVGAQNLPHEQHAYQRLLNAGEVKVTGFERFPDAADDRPGASGLTMPRHFIGDGQRGLFRMNRDRATSSLFEPNFALLDRLEALSDMCSPMLQLEVSTTRLDDIESLSDCDFLKINMQGGELFVLEGAPNLLKQIVAVHCDIKFSSVYLNQPLFGDVDDHLRASGFELIDIINVGYSTAKGLSRPMARSRLLCGEALYLRSPATIEALGPKKVATVAYIAHVNYGFYDVAAHYLSVLDRESENSGHLEKYETGLREPILSRA